MIIKNSLRPFSMRSTVVVKYHTKKTFTTFYSSRKVAFKVSLQRLYALSFPMRKEVLYEIVKNFVKTRKEDPYAFFTSSLRMRKFRISCCDQDIVNFFQKQDWKGWIQIPEIISTFSFSKVNNIHEKITRF